MEVASARMDAVVVTCDSGEIAFESVRALLGEAEVGRVVIVDNASRPEFRRRLREFESSRVTIVMHERNVGFAAGVNAGLARVGAPFAAVINPDCLVDRGSIARLADALDSEPSAGLAGGLVVDRSGREQEGARRDLPTRRHAIARWLGLRAERWRFNHAGMPLPEHPVEVPAVSGAFMAVRRSLLASVGGLDERFKLHFEDLDWCARFRRAGHRVLFVPMARAIHEKGSSSRVRPLRTCFQKHRSMVLFDRLHADSSWARRTRWIFASAVWAGCGLSIVAELMRAIGGRRGAVKRPQDGVRDSSPSLEGRRTPGGAPAA
jgi:hypothetical protein